MIVLEMPSSLAPGLLKRLLEDVARVESGLDVPPEVADIEVLVARGPARIDADLLDRFPNLRLIAALGSGTDHIDVPAARQRGVTVTNNAGAAPEPVAEYVLGAIVALRRQLPRLAAELSTGQGWIVREEQMGRECTGAVLGIIGLGEIGAMVASRARLGLGMQVIAFDPTAHASEYEAAGAAPYDSLGRLLGVADVVSVHVPLTAETHGLLSRHRLSLMKRGAVLINTARGGIVDEEALFDALQSGHLAGAAVDVFAHEPADGNHPLLGLKNVLATPHCAGLSVEGVGRLYEQTAVRIRRFLATHEA